MRLKLEFVKINWTWFSYNVQKMMRKTKNQSNSSWEVSQKMPLLNPTANQKTKRHKAAIPSDISPFLRMPEKLKSHHWEGAHGRYFLICLRSRKAHMYLSMELVGLLPPHLTWLPVDGRVCRGINFPPTPHGWCHDGGYSWGWQVLNSPYTSL